METNSHIPSSITSASQLAKPSCKHCYGTGICGKVMHGYDIKNEDGTVEKADRSPITCICVQRALVKRVPWLQRHGNDQQTWLKEKEDVPQRRSDLAGSETPEAS